MKRAINTATYKEYNANNRGNYSTDCVKRAISMAFDLDYNKVSKLLLTEAKKRHANSWKIARVFEPVIYALGGDKGKAPDDACSVSEFIDNIMPTGTVIMETNSKPCEYGQGNHLTCAVDGVLYDSWDSSTQYVCNYYVVAGAEHNFTDIQDWLGDLIPEGSEICQKLFEKYQQKYQLTGSFELLPSWIDGYSVLIRYKYADDVTGTTRKNTYNTIACVFSPTTSREQAHKKMIDTIKTRMYDKFYAIAKMHRERNEGDDLFTASGYQEGDAGQLYLYGAQKRFFNSLPGWVKPFVVYLDVSNPGRFSDSYQVEILPIKGDPRKPEGIITYRDRVSFYAESSDIIKEEMARYKSRYERPGDDYSVSEEYY